jgi:hypothetical protein
VHRGERLEDRQRADPQAQAPGDQAQQVAGLQGRGAGEQASKQVDLAADAA